MAMRLSTELAARPWRAPSGLWTAGVRLYAPARFCPESERDAEPHASVRSFKRLRDALAKEYRRCAAHVFAGAAGIAVRALAPLLRHKSLDPPAVVISPDGRFAVCLVSGHWGGGNALTRHIARLVGACPVITTASDAHEDAVALDIFLRDAGVRIVDWDELPRAQASLLEGNSLRLWDPCRVLPEVLPPGLKHECCHEEFVLEAPQGHPHAPAVAVHWRLLPRRASLLRCAAPCLFVGLGCRKNTPREAVLEAIEVCFETNGLQPRAIAALATVTEKSREPALVHAAKSLELPVLDFAAKTLARCASPNPSTAAGRRFGQPPFSVCEAAALTAAGKGGRLVLPKVKIAGRLTMAVALGVQGRLEDM